MNSRVDIDWQLSAADRAVKYFLDRIQVDGDLAALIGPRTLAFSLLAFAESHRLQQPLADVAYRRSLDARVHREPSELETLRAEVKRLKAILEQ